MRDTSRVIVLVRRELHPFLETLQNSTINRTILILLHLLSPLSTPSIFCTPQVFFIVLRISEVVSNVYN